MKPLRIRTLGNGRLQVYCDRLHRDESTRTCLKCADYIRIVNFDTLECDYVREEQRQKAAS